MNTDRDFELELSNLTEAYKTEYDKLNKKLNLGFFCFFAFAVFTFFTVKAAVYFSFFYLPAVLFGAAALTGAFTYFKSGNTIKEKSRAYEKERGEIVREAYMSGHKTVSAPLPAKSAGVYKINIISVVIVFVFSLVAFRLVGDYKLEKWLNYTALRPFMLEDFGYYQRSVGYDDAKGDKENYPDLLRSYTREELTEIFGSNTENDPTDDIIVTYSDDFNGNIVLDAHYSFQDPFGKVYWVVILYQKSADGYDYLYSDVMPSGTRVKIHRDYFDVS